MGRPRSERPGRLLACLIDNGALDPATAHRAQTEAAALGADLGRYLIRSGHVAEAQVLSAIAQVSGTRLVDLAAEPADRTLSEHLEPEIAIALGSVPYAQLGQLLVVATYRSDLLEEIRTAFPDRHIVFALATRNQITDEIARLYGDPLARTAEARAPLEASSRVWNGLKLGNWVGLTGAALLAVLILFPLTAQLVMFGVAGLIFLGNMGLKMAAGLAAITRPTDRSERTGDTIVPLYADPVVTIMVPLFRERDIAHKILARIDRLDYPRRLLDVIFVLEEGDETTREALSATELPFWARAIAVPPGHPQTKPRALNYALPFARGSIIGIYDAEDSPEPDQLRKVTARFATAPPGLACLQGQLDYYNATHNWIARSFTVEYATWFRLLLPGVERLGLVLPLGGTTLFIQREALIRVGAWDAHNVTEDAELGLRLARAGYRTEIVETTTFEEANSAIWPWIRQRSRWLKGYAITWATAMRQPRALWRDLGPKRFFGFQAQMAGTVLGFLTAPLLWTLALIPLGIPHPMAAYLTPPVVILVSVLFGISLALTLALSWRACRAEHLRQHRPWLWLLIGYFPLASAATVAALIDLVTRPFYWAKTAHGRYGEDTSPPPSS